MGKNITEAIHVSDEQIEELKKIFEKAKIPKGLSTPAFTEKERTERYEKKDKGKYTFIVESTLEIIPGEPHIIKAEFDDIGDAIRKTKLDLMTIAHLSPDSIIKIRLQRKR